ncbi:erythromycin esterase family protein [Alishewanella longhuensis]
MLDSASYYARLLEGVIRLFEVHYQVRRFDEHDLAMANNIHWLLENLYNNQKIIVWGHNVHVNRQR